ncbi:MFS transporter [Xanthobacter autotrophicus]|uniref:MFS transporter n=1 Tax=Xanthobacter TaxID=279 RepID=UPI0024AB8C2C|nr:MFS transporter [Xanthobacter autotrophicus]MDI4664607.1 MFS transporter [Xanthobacter autotrophicus]
MPFLLVLGLAAFASAFSMRAVDPMLNILAADLNVTLQEVALLASAFTLPYATMQLLFGPIGDAVGKVRLIRFNLAMLAVGLAVSALVPGHPELLAARMLSGAFAGGVIPVVLATVGDRVSFEMRPLALSRVLLALVLGQLVGSAAAGFIAEYAGWRPVFWCAFGVAAVAFLSAMVGITEERQRQPLSFGAALARYGTVLKNPLSIKVYAVVAVEGALTFGVFPLAAPLMVEHGLGDAVEAGLVLGAFAIGGAFYTFAVPVLVRRLGLAGMIGAGAAGVGILFGAAAVGPNLPVVVALFAASGFAFYMIHNVLQILATELSAEARGSAVSLFASAFFVGQAVGAVILAQAAGVLGAAPVFALAGLGMLILAAPASLLPPRKAKAAA